MSWKSLRNISLAALVFTPMLAAAATALPKWVVFNSAGILVRGAGATATANLSTGTYQATFLSDISRCAYIATPGDVGAGAVSGPVVATVATRSGNPNALFLQTWNQSTGALENDPLHVITYCGNKELYAVVDANGVLARGSRVTGTAHPGVGQYKMTFNQDVSRCAYTATIGTISAGSVPNPGVITVQRNANPNVVFVRTYSRTGPATDFPFHLAVDCGGTKLFATIRVDGTKARGANVVSASKLSGPGGGTYEVIFNRTVAGCAYTAAISIGLTTIPVTITTATRAGNSNGVFIFIHKTDGSTFDDPFNLALAC